MKKDKIVFWVSTSIISLMMLFSASQYFMNPKMAGAFVHFGFPNYFRIELGIAKIIGAIVLLVPQFPTKIKELAYAGFLIVLISASVAHYACGDPMANVITPIVLLGILLVSNVYLGKIKN